MRTEGISRFRVDGSVRAVAKNYAEAGQILKETDDRTTKAKCVFDCFSPGFPDLPRRESELKAIGSLIEKYDRNPQVLAWFNAREAEFEIEERARQAAEDERLKRIKGNENRTQGRKVIRAAGDSHHRHP